MMKPGGSLSKECRRFMPPRFLIKTALLGGQALVAGQGLALQQYERLHAALRQRAGSAAAALFAEPVTTWGTEAPGEISWYSEVEGVGTPFATMPADRRAVLEVRLRQQIAMLGPLLDDQEIGPLLRAALCIRSMDSLFAVGDQLVLTEWGMAPDGARPGRDPAALLQASPLAGFMTAAPPPRPAVAAASAAPVLPVPPPMATVPRPAAARALSAAWFAIPAALALAAIFLAIGYWRGALLAADRAANRPNTVSVLDEEAGKRALRDQEQLNAALEKQIEDRRKLLAGNVCVADPATLPRLGPNQAAAPPAAVVPPPPGGQPFQGNLADLLKQGIVMVLVPGAENSLSVGTGFFVTPELIVTNRHVIEGARDGKVAVINVRLGHLLRGTVVASTPNSDIGSLDVALLRVEPQVGIQPLAFTKVAAELDPVIAAGYPALITRSDAGMQRLLQDGDLTAAPQLVLTDGRIQAIQTSPGGVMIMPHGAAISGGNSGGPLVDGCGRVVGINTFIRSDTEAAAHANYAEKSDSVLPFLVANGAAVVEVGGPCSPGAPAAPATPPAVVTPAALAPTTPAPTTATPATPAPATPAPLAATPAPATPAPASPAPSTR